MQQGKLHHGESAMANKILYCVAYEEFKNGTWKPELEYFHVQNVKHSYWLAKKKFTIQNSNKLMFGRIKIVDIAPVIGYYIEEDKNRNLIYSV